MQDRSLVTRILVAFFLPYSRCLTAFDTTTSLRRECTCIRLQPFPWNIEKIVGDDFNYFPWRPRSKHVVHFSNFQKQTTEVMDEYFMGLALQQARKAASKQEVPIGAVLVRPVYHAGSMVSPTSFEVLTASHNQVEHRMDAVAHAEILCLRAAAKKLSNWRLVNTTLYTTLEPCIACLSAAYAFRIDRIVYGARDFRLGAVTSWVEWDKVMPEKHPYHPNGRIVVLGGIREDECGTILKHFFRLRRIQEADRKSKGKDMIDQSVGAKRPLNIPIKIQSLLRRLYSLISDYVVTRIDSLS